MIDVQLAFCSDDLCSIGTCGNDFLCNTPCSKRSVQLAVVLLPWKGQDISLGFSQKKPEQKLDKKWTQDFFDSPTGNPATGQKMDNFTILVNLLFVHLLSWCHTLPILPFYNDIACLDKSWTSSRHCPERFPID